MFWCLLILLLLSLWISCRSNTLAYAMCCFCSCQIGVVDYLVVLIMVQALLSFDPICHVVGIIICHRICCACSYLIQ